jgi:hypothetical protein
MFLIGSRLNDLEVHLGTRLDAGDLTGDLGPMPMLAGITLCTAAQGSPLHLVIGVNRIGFCKPPVSEYGWSSPSQSINALA